MWWEFLLWAGVWALVFWLPQNCQHEGAHAIAAWWAGGTIEKFWPFPGRNSEGKWCFAHVRYGEWKHPFPTVNEQVLMHVAPVLANGAILSATVPILIAAKEEWLLGWVLINVVDFGNQLRLLAGKRGDLWKAWQKWKGV